jgi:hypothetical protein
VRGWRARRPPARLARGSGRCGMPRLERKSSRLHSLRATLSACGGMQWKMSCYYGGGCALGAPACGRCGAGAVRRAMKPTSRIARAAAASPRARARRGTPQQNKLRGDCGFGLSDRARGERPPFTCADGDFSVARGRRTRRVALPRASRARGCIPQRRSRADRLFMRWATFSCGLCLCGRHAWVVSLLTRFTPPRLPSPANRRLAPPLCAPRVQGDGAAPHAPHAPRLGRRRGLRPLVVA